ncbi:MAG: hypothetical protein CL406_06825 [Acidimicrobiaceae bacterium]|nr:hypothetical protein [Acidimicrobiaceae bacterium]
MPGPYPLSEFGYAFCAADRELFSSAMNSAACETFHFQTLPCADTVTVSVRSLFGLCFTEVMAASGIAWHPSRLRRLVQKLGGSLSWMVRMRESDLTYRLPLRPFSLMAYMPPPRCESTARAVLCLVAIRP